MSVRHITLGLAAAVIGVAAPLATPAMADRAMLNVAVNSSMMRDRPLLRGYAMCLLANGDPTMLDQIMQEQGFAKDDQPDMGAVFYTSSDLPFTISSYMNGEICDVSSETEGTDVALGHLVAVGGMVGFSMLDRDCSAFVLAGSVTAELTSSGNDPVCTSETSSNARFTFGAAAPAN